MRPQPPNPALCVLQGQATPSTQSRHTTRPVKVNPPQGKGNVISAWPPGGARPYGQLTEGRQVEVGAGKEGSLACLTAARPATRACYCRRLPASLRCSRGGLRPCPGSSTTTSDAPRSAAVQWRPRTRSATGTGIASGTPAPGRSTSRSQVAAGQLLPWLAAGAAPPRRGRADLGRGHEVSGQ
jgi:hypothetical protein